MSKLKYDVNQEPIVTSKATFDILLKQDQPSDLIALYHFYYYTAKWQQTNHAKATTPYVANGLKWSEPRVRKNKKVLIALGLIEDITKKDPITKSITGHYIKVNFIWHLPERNPHYANANSVGILGANTLQTNNINTLQTNKEERLNYIVAENSATVNSKNEKYLPIAYKLGEIITSKKKIKINQSKLKSWAVSIRQLIEKDGVQIERVNTALDWYSDNIGGDYVPVIESGKSLREKFIKLENAIERDKKPIAGKTRTGFKRGKIKYKRPEKL